MKRRLSFWVVTLLCLGAIGILALRRGDERPSLHAVVDIGTGLVRGTVKATQEPVVLTPQREREAAAQFLSSIPLVDEDHRDSQYVSRVGSGLLAKLKGTSYSYEIHLSSWSMPNALALPGGILIVTQGLLEMVSSEAELAAVMGHEIMHVENGHWRDTLKSRSVGERTGQDVTGVIYRIFEMGFSKAQELEADRTGIVLAAEAGYAPRAGVVLFRRFGAMESPDQTVRRDPLGMGAGLARSAVERYFQSHPPARERIEGIEQAIRDYRVNWRDQSFYWGNRNFRERIPLTERTWTEERLPLGSEPRF